MADSPKRDSSNEWSDSNPSSGLQEHKTVGTSSNSSNATSPFHEDDHPSRTFPDDETDRSPNLTPNAAGERLEDWLSNAGSSRNASVTAYSPGSHAEEAQAPSPRPAPSRTLRLPEERFEQTQTHDSIADRRRKASHPVRFADSNIQTKAKTIPAPDTVDASARSNPTRATATIVNILTKIELLPVLVALRASARPGADPEEAHKALEQAMKARAFAQQQGADTILLSQCSYYTAIANFAVGQSDQDKTLALFTEAREAKGLNAEGDWADRWISYVQEQERLHKDSGASSVGSRSSSFLGGFLDPIATMLGASRLSWSGSKASNVGRRRTKPAGLYAQMAPSRRDLLATRPAAKRMPIWSDSNSSAVLPSRALHRYGDSMNRLPTWRSSQWSRPASSVEEKEPLPLEAANKRDSQGNFTHLNTGFKYNEDHPFGIGVPFVASPESYEPSFTSSHITPEDDKPPTHPPVKRYYIVNPDPSDPSSSSASVGAVKTAKPSSSNASVDATPSSRKTTSPARIAAVRTATSPSDPGTTASDGEEVPQPKRKTSWIRKLSLATPDRETGSPTKSLEAMIEEGESPGFKPEGWGRV